MVADTPPFHWKDSPKKLSVTGSHDIQCAAVQLRLSGAAAGHRPLTSWHLAAGQVARRSRRHVERAAHK